MIKTIGFLIVLNITTVSLLINQQDQIDKLSHKVKNNSFRLYEIESWIEKKSTQLNAKPIAVTVTGYTARKVETDHTPNQTAFLTIPKPWTVAVSRDLFLKGWIPGRKVYIYQVGVFKINDLMHINKTKQLDVFFRSLKQAKKFGIKRAKAILL